MIRARIIYRGNVQGVGFRFTVKNSATQIGLCGWVKNLSNGSVEILAEGTQGQVDQFLDKLEDHFKLNISHVEKAIKEGEGRFKDFQIFY